MPDVEVNNLHNMGNSNANNTKANGLWEIIEPQPTTKADVKKDKAAITYLYQSLPED